MAWHRSRFSRRAALTLMELLVVLVILIALAGVVVPILPSMLTRAHTSTCATNIGDTVRMVQVYQQLYSAYPNNWDALSDGTKIVDYLAGGTALPAKFGGPGTSTSMAAGQVTDSTLSDGTGGTPNELGSLQNAGITTVQLMTQTKPNDPTFDYYASTTPISTNLAKSTHLAFLDPATNNAALLRCQQLNLSTTGRYVLLGVGPRNDMVGKTMASAPVHFGDTPALNPQYGYERLVAIMKVSDTAIPNFNTAVLVGIAPIHDDGLGSIDDELQNWYQLSNGGT